MTSRRLLMCVLLTNIGIALGSHPCFGQTTTGGGIPSTSGTPTTTTASSSTSGGSTAPTGAGSGASQVDTAQKVTAIQLKPIATSSGTGSATSMPSNSNPFVSWYGDPLSMGLPSKFLTGPPTKPTATFGKGNYVTTTNTSAATPTAQATQAAGFNTNGIPRAPLYTTRLADDFPIKTHSSEALHSDVRGVIDRSSYVKNKSAIQVNVNGNAIALSGQVSTEKERRMVEAMVRMTPGVVDVRNALTVQAK